MKKSVILLVAVFLSINTMAQEIWTKTVIDNHLTVSLPGNIETMDTMGQKVFFGSTENGVKAILSRLQMKGELQTDTAALSTFYKEFMTGVLEESKDYVLGYSKKNKLGGLQSFEFGYTSSEEAMGYSEVIVVFTKDVIYSIVITSDKADDVKKAKTKFMSAAQLTFKEGMKVQIK